MFKTKIFTSFLLLFICENFSAQTVDRLTDPGNWVNTLMGSQSKHSLSNGNTYPAIALPWGMNFWSPQTAKMGDGWMYNYESDKIRGFKQTHQPSPWINDYGQFSIMPVTGNLTFVSVLILHFFGNCGFIQITTAICTVHIVWQNLARMLPGDCWDW